MNAVFFSIYKAGFVWKNKWNFQKLKRCKKLKNVKKCRHKICTMVKYNQSFMKKFKGKNRNTRGDERWIIQGIKKDCQ